MTTYKIYFADHVMESLTERRPLLATADPKEVANWLEQQVDAGDFIIVAGVMSESGDDWLDENGVQS